MASSRLMITDGTLRINLLAIPGFQLESWRPVIPAYKGDGTYQSSPLSDGRQIVNRQFDNPIEQFGYKSQDFTQDELITRTQDLVRLLEKAVAYWVTDWQNEPVWIEASAKCETNIRYGHIMSYRIPELENPFNQPFLQPDNSAVMDSMTLILEHTIWTENQPGTGTAVELSAVETYDGRSLGNVDSVGSREPTTANEVYVANKRNEANLTDIYRDDGGAFSPNLMDVALPYKLLPTVPAVNDAIYFGIDTSLSDSGPFNSLIFDISIAGAGYTGLWENWTGAVWSTLTIQDNTNADGAMTGIAFDTIGVNSVTFRPSSPWVTTSVNGVTGYWIRYRVTGIPGALTSPTQQNRDVYSVVWPYVDILSDAVEGDIQSLTTIEIIQEGDGSDIPSTTLFGNRYIGGLRTYNRGSNFTSFLNASDEQNPSGITAAVGANTTFTTHAGTPTGRVTFYNPVGVEAMADRITWTLDDTISTHFYGKFHAFMTGTHTTSAGSGLGNIRVRLRVKSGSGNIEFVSDIQDFTLGTIIVPPTNLVYNLIDFGKVSIPSSKISSSESVGTIELAIQAQTISSSPLLDLYITSLILIPVDEFAFDSDDAQNDSDSRVDRGRYLFLDSIEYPKVFSRSLVRQVSDDDIISVYPLISNGKIIMQSNTRQRFWFFSAYHSTAGQNPLVAPFAQLHSVLVKKNQQYTTMRGSR